MSINPQVTVTDQPDASINRGHAWVGRAFFFADELTDEMRSILSRRSDLLLRGPWVVGLQGRENLKLPGYEIRPFSLPQLRLRSVTTDRAIYDQTDEVNVLAVDLTDPTSDHVLSIRANECEYTRLPIELDTSGCRHITLRDLPAGEYDIEWDGERRCSFTVAAYRLAPLVGSVVEETWNDETKQLLVTLRLESFGLPVHSPVKLELFDGTTRIQEVTRHARRGEVSCPFSLRGAGPYSINVQMTGAPSRTATIPIVGSRARDRASTRLSRLGDVTVASLLPGDTSKLVRGLYLDTKGTEASPVRLERVDSRIAHLEALADIYSFRAMVIDPSKPTHNSVVRTIERRQIIQGQSLSIELPETVTVLALGGFVESRPWEGWAAMLSPSGLNPGLDVPSRAQPGEGIRVKVRTGNNENAMAYLVVKDARLLSCETPNNQLAREIKRTAAIILIAADRESVPLADVPVSRNRRPTRPVHPPGPPFSKDELWDIFLAILRGERPFPDIRTVRFMARSDSRIANLLSEHKVHGFGCESELSSDVETVLSAQFAPERSTSHIENAARRETQRDAGEVLFAGLLSAPDGEAEVDIALGETDAEYIAEAFVVTDTRDWTSVEQRFHVTKSPYVELEVPRFLHPLDGGSAQLHVRSSSGKMQVSLTCDGRQVVPSFDGARVGPTDTISRKYASLEFPVRIGDYHATVWDVEDGTTDEAMARVEALGRTRTTVRVLRLLQPGQRISRADDGNIRSLRLVPTLKRPLRVLVDATANYIHSCCEQTAAKLVAATLMYVSARDAPERRQRAESIVVACAAHLKHMWVPGERIKMYPEMDARYPAIEKRTARHLSELPLVRPRVMSRALQEALDLAVNIARDLNEVHGIHWPPVELRDCADAYAVLCLSEDPADRQRALDFVRGHDVHEAVDHGPIRGLLRQRCEKAYAAAALLHGGNPADLQHALTLANDVVQQFDENGRLHSTVDSIAAISLMRELESAHIVGLDTKVLVNGLACSRVDAYALSQIETIECVEGVIAVEVMMEICDEGKGGVPIEVSLEKDGERCWQFRAGDAVDLVIELPEGYTAGDLAWIFLPDALSRVVGGGQSRRFPVDFRGKNQLKIPLAVTSTITFTADGIPGPNHLVVWLRNMFEEERAGISGPVDFTISIGEPLVFQ